MRIFIIIAACCIATLTFSQNKPVYIYAGFATTDLQIKEATSVTHLPGIPQGSSSTGKPDYSAIGFHVGVGTMLGHFVIDLSGAVFKGNHTLFNLQSTRYSYRLNSCQVPLTINYLIRNPEKRFNIGIGPSVQYLQAHLTQYASGYPNTDTSVSEVELLLNGMLSWRVSGNLDVTGNYKAMFWGRQLTNTSLCIRYTLRDRFL